MIASLTGSIVDRPYVDGLVILVGGVGYHVTVSDTDHRRIMAGDRESVTLYTHQVISETQHRLYGFLDADAHAIFLRIIALDGIGPTTGLRVLSSMSAAEAVAAARANDVKKFQALHGIGAKTAARIVEGIS